MQRVLRRVTYPGESRLAAVSPLLCTWRLLCLWAPFPTPVVSFRAQKSHSATLSLGTLEKPAPPPFAFKDECPEIHRDSSLLTPACWRKELWLKLSCRMVLAFYIASFLWKMYLETSNEGADLGLEVSLLSVRKTMFTERFFLITTWLFSLHQTILEL